VRSSSLGKAFNAASVTADSGYLSAPLPSIQAHRFTYIGLWLFTALLIFRPGDSIPAFARLSFPIAVVTLIVFCITQLWLERRLTAHPVEVNLVLALSLVALISIPEGVDPGQSYTMFSDIFIKPVLMFIVMVNVVRNAKRLQLLLQLVLAAGVYVSYSAISAFRRGEFSIEGYRVKGNLGATLSDPNDTALFLVTMIPIALALMLASRERWPKIIYGCAAALMTGAVFVTYSRGGFLALSFASAFLCWKMFRRSPVATASFVAIVLTIAMFLVPSNYSDRVSSIFGGDSRGSSSARKNLLQRSIQVASENPIIGVGMANFPLFSIRGQASHNSYTQVAAEMGLPALAIYLAFLLTPIRRLRRIERETRGVSAQPQYKSIHFLALGLQASLIGFMIGSFFLSVAYYWFIYYLVGYAVCLGRVYETGPGRIIGTYTIKESPQS
jgi:probable O-glycosylation ligase (exosortase A-associated)